MDEKYIDDGLDGKYDRIREALESNCTEELVRSLECPQCGGGVLLRVNVDGKRFFVRCATDSEHLAMHGRNELPPDWFGKLPRVGWYGSKKA